MFNSGTGTSLAPPTLRASDVYPQSQLSRGTVAPATQTASGNSGAGSNPAMFWIGLVVLAVLARVVFEMAPEA